MNSANDDWEEDCSFDDSRALMRRRPPHDPAAPVDDSKRLTNVPCVRFIDTGPRRGQDSEATSFISTPSDERVSTMNTSFVPFDNRNPSVANFCILDRIRPDLWRPETPSAVAHIFGGLESYRINRGLGCSEEILDQINEFVVGMLEMFEPECPTPELLYRNIVVSYSKVFQPNTDSHLETLRQVWNLVPMEIKVMILTELVQIANSTASGASSPQIFFKTLKELSVL
ncbi:hypothetical protein BKA67DRAFT_667946 [Truncatella angustata]|uniref:Uncharacterized protein n=1 Tax=Truncatella angustata TaxID=152316 RepID=A0A9P8UZS1_9PEZI|nr:uncharacterized protein BKA67DRAFT_667946 [Truncatella angustata]KAH6660981.1 hypothetical protein BKA67DRAFT_667946 [Truncatella angustata]